MKIIDFRTRPRTQYFFRDIVPEPIPAFKPYFAHYHMDKRMKLAALEESVEEMQGAGIHKGVIFGTDEQGCIEIQKVRKKYPDAYIGLIDISISQGVTRAVDTLEKAYTEYDIKGLTLSPFISGIYPTDARYYPLYSLSEKMGKVVQIHSSTHFNPDTALDLGDPHLIDKIAVDFPKLKLVLGHAGMGFGLLGVTVAQRHPNMFIDFTGLRPRYLPPEMVQGINTILRKKAIFGTNYPSLSYDIIDEWKAIVPEEIQPYFFYKNAAKALGIDE